MLLQLFILHVIAVAESYDIIDNELMSIFV